MGLGADVRAIARSRDLGLGVFRAAAFYGAATVDLFRISNGNVLLKALFGITSAGAIPAFATTVQFRANATAGAAVVLDSGAADLTGAAIGTMFGPTGTPADPCGLGFAVAGLDQGFIIPIGTIDFICGRATTPAQIRFVMYYVPLDLGATVSVA